MASPSGTLYIGMTNDLSRRVIEHQRGLVEGFTKEYNCIKLVYCEYYQWATEAIGREKQLKRWRRDKKVGLIEKINPTWKDLSKEWC